MTIVVCPDSKHEAIDAQQIEPLTSLIDKNSPPNHHPPTAYAKGPSVFICLLIINCSAQRVLQEIQILLSDFIFFL